MQEKYQNIFDIITRQVSLDHFQQYVLDSPEHSDELFSAIRECRTQGFPRFNIWRMLLEVIPVKGDYQQKKDALDATRKRWEEVKTQAKTGIKASPHKPKEPAPVVPKNPLMKLVSKPQKKQVQSDSFLSEEIKKDVDRTYQEMQFFQDPQVLKLLSIVLFVWCKLNPDISYKQGMNELLASIVYVYFKEAVPANFQASSQMEEKYLFLNSVAYAEADIFTIFEKIMEIQKEMYKENLDKKDDFNPNSKNNSPILQRIIQLQDQKLKATDLQLFRVLKLQDVKTKTFLLRWIRCMHTRQFGLVGSLQIWDSIFLDAFESPNSKNRKQYQFVDAMCLAMFIYLRAVVLTRETSNEILQIYQKYPQLEGHFLQELVRLAWSVCEELRNMTNNPTSNFFEDSDKIKKLGLMNKGGYQTLKTQKSSSHNYHSPLPQQKDNNLVKKSPLKSVSHQENGSKGKDQGHVKVTPPSRQKIFEDEQEDDGFFKKPKTSKASPGKSKSPAASKPQNDNDKPEKPPKASQTPVKPRTIAFDEKQIKAMIENLKQSSNLNDDIQSRALTNKVLKVLEDKLN